MGGGAHPGIVPGGRGAAGGSSQDEGREPRGRRLGSRPVEEKVKQALFSSIPFRAAASRLEDFFFLLQVYLKGSVCL